MTSSAASARPAPESRQAYQVFRDITTRWMDNDIYGHINNVVYYAWFDAAVNAHLIEQGVLDIHAGRTIGLVVETHCNYFAPLAFPHPSFREGQHALAAAVAGSAIAFLVAGVGGLMLFSIAGASWEPWADKHLLRFGVYFIIMIVLVLRPKGLFGSADAKRV